MLNRRDWFLYILGPLLAVLGIDLASKAWAFTLGAAYSWGPLRLMTLENTGFLLGSMKDASRLTTVVLPTAVGATLVFTFMVVQYFLPIRSPVFRAGLSILLGGVLGNVVDRMLYGHVRDFILLTGFGKTTGVFNVADALQWVGAGMFLGSYIANGSVLYPPAERRGRKWIDSDFQLRYCLTLIGFGSAYAMISAALSYSFLSVSIAQVTSLPVAEARNFVTSFWAFYAGTTISFLVLLFVAGVLLSHRIVGPIKGFENFLADLIAGKQRGFKTRRHDEFRHLEELAVRFRLHFNDAMGIPATRAKEGDAAPQIEAKTFDNRTVRLADYQGKKVWFIFYRYVTCPLCATNLDEIKEMIARAKAAGIEVLIVYESTAEQVQDALAGSFGKLLKQVDVPIITDPERMIYAAYGTENRMTALFHPRTALAFIRSQLKGYPQGKISGRLSQLPAHFIIDEGGRIELAYYGEHLGDNLSLETVERFVSPLEARLKAGA